MAVFLLVALIAPSATVVADATTAAVSPWVEPWMWDRDADEVDDRLQAALASDAVAHLEALGHALSPTEKAALRALPATGPVNVVLGYSTTPTDADIAAAARIGFVLEYQALFLPVLTGAIDATRVHDAAALPGVERVEHQLVYHTTNSVATKALKARPSSTYASTVWDDFGLRGAGVNVAILDTGVDDHQHEAFTGKYVCGYQAVTQSNSNPDDDNEHGTHVAGTAVGHGGNANYPYGTNAGVAPDAGLIDIKVLTSGGSSSGSSVLRGIEWAQDNAAACGIDIISLSLGTLFADDGRSSDALAINNAADAGLIPLIAAGNHNTPFDDFGIGSPGSADNAITVAAMNDRNTVTRGDDSVAGFSNTGPRNSDNDQDFQDERKPEVIAPGDNIMSARYNTANQYTSFSGTSMATPAMAGVVALMLQANPDLDWRDVEAIIIATSEDYGSGGWDGSYGYGYADAYDAVQAALDMASPNTTPTACFSRNTNELTVNVDAACSSDADGSITNYAWNFGDGATGSGATASHTYATGGTFTITLTVTDNRGGTDTQAHSVTVSTTPNAAPTACFTHSESGATANVDAGCSSDPDGSIASYAWNWGDGSPAGSGATASHAYATGGTFTVTLTVTDDDGATDTQAQSVTVAAPPNAAPTACFTTSTSALTATANGGCSSDSDGSVASYAWAWGDGATGSGASASHTYASDGTFTVTLTVTDDDGATDATSQSVTVTADPDPGATTVSNGVAYSATSGGAGSDQFYKINVPSGATSLTVTLDGPSCGVFSCQADLDLSVREGARPTDNEHDCRPYEGDSDESCSFSNPAGGWWFARVDVYSGSGPYTITMSFDARNAAPTACFTHSEAGSSTSVDGGCSSDSDGSVSSYSWDWGDGSPDGSGATATHAYGAGGTFTVTLTVTDNDGATDTATASVTVAAPPNAAPSACFTTSTSGLTATANGGCSSDSDGSVSSWSWDWGDGATGSGSSASHTYATAGTFTVTLTVTDDDGATAVTSDSVTVTADPDPGAITLTNGQAFSDSLQGAGSEKFYKIAVPAGQSDLTVTLDGPGCGLFGCNPDLDLYVKRGARPTATDHDCRPYEGDSDESCSFTNPAADWWFVRVTVFEGSSSGSFTVTATFS